jgi:hypothetical protein
MVVETRKGETGGRELDLFIYRAGIEIVAVRYGRSKPPFNGLASTDGK